MRRLLAPILLLSVVSVACGSSSDEPIVVQTTTTGMFTTTTTTTPADDTGTTTSTTYGATSTTYGTATTPPATTDLDTFSGISGDDRTSPEEATAIISRATAVLILANHELDELEADAFNYEKFGKSLQHRLTEILSNLFGAHTELSQLALRGSANISTEQIIDLVDEVQLTRDRLAHLLTYLSVAASSTLTDDVLYLPKGIRVMLLDPLPHHITRSPSLFVALLEHLLWYPALILAAIGIYSNRNTLFRRTTGSPELLYVFLLLCGLIVMWGLVEGNFGTAFRHRGEFVWAVAVFTGLGFARVRLARTHGVTDRESLDHSNDD